MESIESAKRSHFLNMAYEGARRVVHGTATRDDEAVLWALNRLSHLDAELRAERERMGDIWTVPASRWEGNKE